MTTVLAEPTLFDPPSGALRADSDAAFAARAFSHARRRLALQLAAAQDASLPAAFGCSSMVQYGACELDLDPRETQALLEAGQRLRSLPRTDAELVAGHLSWRRAELLMRVVTPTVEKAWLEVARDLPWSTLRQQVEGARRGRPPRRRRATSAGAPARA